MARKTIAKKTKSRLAKKRRKPAAAKTVKRAKDSARKKAAVAKQRRKITAAKQAGAAAGKEPAATPQPAALARTTARETLTHKIAGAFKAVVDTLAEAEQLHHRLDPDPSKDTDPE
jgi:hypothetical protein